MHATVRRYEGVDQSRTDELTKKLDESLLPRLSKLPGFEGYYLIEAGNGVIRSLAFLLPLCTPARTRPVDAAAARARAPSALEIPGLFSASTSAKGFGLFLVSPSTETSPGAVE